MPTAERVAERADRAFQDTVAQLSAYLEVYGHLALQPVNLANWRTDPHTAVVQDGRLYARGAADDMGGWVSHLAAIRAWLEESGSLPCNLRLLLEEEEEIGSPNLERFMDATPQAFQADVVILTDCENPSTEIPGLTVSLRGLLEIQVTCRALSADGHSGLWGNMVPDPCIALVQLIARIVDEDGRLAIGRVSVPQAWAEGSKRVPLNDAVITEGAHLLEGVTPLPHRGKTPAEWMWRQPSVTLEATTLPSEAQKKNAIRSEAGATLSVRVPPGVEPADLYAEIAAELTRTPAPQGVLVTVSQRGHASEGWLYEPKGPAFEAADRAYQKSWGHPLVQIGVVAALGKGGL